MKRRIFLIVSSIEKGGTQKIILDLFNYWKKKGHNVKIITFDKKIDLKIKKNLINLKLQNTSKNLFHAIFNNLKRIYKLRNIIKNNKYNHIVSFISTTNILAIISNIGLKNNLIISERNDPELQNIGYIWIILRKVFYRYADKVSANSKKACTYLEKFVPKKKIFFIPNHIFLNKNKQKIKKDKILLAIGRLHYQKGFDTLIDSFNLSKIYKFGWKLVIPIDRRPILTNDEYHYYDLVGLEARIDPSKALIGYVTDLIKGGNDLLEIELVEGKKVLVPFVKEIVPEIEIKEKWLLIKPPPGLLELK